MNIGYDAKRYFHNRSGLGNYSRDLVRILSTHYPENNYLLYTPKKIDFEPTDNVRARFPTDTLRNRIFPSFWRSRTIVNDLKKDGVQIFHGLSGEIPFQLRQAGIASVVTIHDLIFLRHPELYKAIDRSIYTRKFRYAVQEANRIVAISQQTKRDIVHFFGIPETHIEVIYQGCHPSFKTFKSTDELQRVRDKYRLPNTFVLNVGSIEPRKNAFQVVKAIEQLDIPLVIVGKQTRYAEEIRKYLVEKRMQHRVLFPTVESMDDLSAIYKLASVFVYPSTYEGFGIPIIEALYAGTPVITSNSGVFPEAAGPFSYFIDPTNVEEIAHAIQSVLSSTSMQDEMIHQGIAFAQQFNDEALAAKWMDCYKQLQRG
ncbi:glycosyltransferase family 4 protein [Sphingobacterium suaedae]|uniref:Glycosyltransferase family 4 protein n=1 Tax=Sphingobacterium suaedae TaxID=1686402 RepID=A0ABW5KKG1_9SPHI